MTAIRSPSTCTSTGKSSTSSHLDSSQLSLRPASGSVRLLPRTRTYTPVHIRLDLVLLQSIPAMAATTYLALVKVRILDGSVGQDSVLACMHVCDPVPFCCDGYSAPADAPHYSPSVLPSRHAHACSRRSTIPHALQHPTPTLHSRPSTTTLQPQKRRYPYQKIRCSTFSNTPTTSRSLPTARHAVLHQAWDRQLSALSLTTRIRSTAGGK